MPDELINKALTTVREAQDYLDRRKGSSPIPQEQDYIIEWKETLNDITSWLTSSNLEIASDAPSRGHLSDQLDLTRSRIQQLHEYNDLASIDVVLRSLQNQIAMIAGTHGPGGGRPGGSGGGKPTR